ncbi:MAG: hypothetical protein ACM34E_17485 [Acidobacteriota bacterium]
MTAVAKDSVLKLLKDLAALCGKVSDQHVRVRRVQCDEIWAFIDGKDKNLTMAQRERRSWQRAGRGLCGMATANYHSRPRSDIAERKPQRR